MGPYGHLIQEKKKKKRQGVRKNKGLMDGVHVRENNNAQTYNKREELPCP
jgi:hypothetical protein